ncbi:MAG TPA: O-methyltransferase [Acidimicrobiales bacterium]|nr:MAG: methyltransferase [Actinobacteria bacterium 21-73-9]HQU25719.1 O-methyltransferase [Acidimicrobiales bacterium]
MSAPDWDRVDHYLASTLLEDDPVLEAALAASDEAGLPPIAVSPLQGRLLGLLVRAVGARRVLEVGTLGGYSAICLARGLAAGGHLVTLELEPRHAEVARANLERAGLADRVEVRVGPAAETLRAFAREGVEPFDLVFIDADKSGYPEYFELALGLVRVGAVIVADNVVRDGEVADATSSDEAVRGVRRFLERVGREPRVEATAVQTVGVKGYDGFAVVAVVA